jgi:hypothetical protein
MRLTFSAYSKTSGVVVRMLYEPRELARQIMHARRDTLTLQDIELLEAAIDGRLTLDQFARLQAMHASLYPAPAPAPVAPVVVIDEERRPARRPRPDSRPACVLKPDAIETSPGDETDETLHALEDIVTAIALISPANRHQLVKAAEYIIEHQRAGRDLSRLLSGLDAIDNAAGLVRNSAIDLKNAAFDKLLDEIGESDELTERDRELNDNAEAAHFRGVVARHPGQYKPASIDKEMRNSDHFDRAAHTDKSLTRREQGAEFRNHGRNTYRAMCQEYS